MTLDQLNALSTVDAASEFLKCCGSSQWAESMAAARPFATVAELLKTADNTYSSLGESDWLEAFRAHPKIGEKKAATTQAQQAQSWSAQEQSGVADASAQTKDELARLNRLYEDRFGFIFIVCASGKSSEEMLGILKSRLGNNRESETHIAAEEQLKITRLRLEKLLSQ